MNSQQVAYALRAFIEQHFRIDSWGLNPPSNIDDPLKPPSSAREEPVIDAIGTSGFFDGYGAGPALGEERYAFTITYLLGQNYSYEEMLQRKRSAADVIKRMSFSVRQTPDCLAIEFQEIELNGTVVLAQVDNKDWWLVIKLMFVPAYEIEPEDLEDFAPWSAPESVFDPSNGEPIAAGAIRDLQAQITQLQMQLGSIQEAVTWQQISGDQAMSPGNAYLVDAMSLTLLTLPSTARMGDRLAIVSVGNSLWRITQTENQQIQIGNRTTTVGETGRVTILQAGAAWLVALSTDRWLITLPLGNFEVI